MNYKVHKLDITSKTMSSQLENFLNTLKGDVVSVIPNVKPTFQLMGATAKVDYILVVEKLK